MKSISFFRVFAPALQRTTLCLATLGGLAFPMTASAKEGDSFLCEITPGGRLEVAFPEIVGVLVGSETEETYVIDPIINYYYGDPIPAKLMADNDARLSLRWVVKFTDETGLTIINMRYDLLILKSNMSARIRIQNSVGDSLEFTAPGTCVREKW